MASDRTFERFYVLVPARGSDSDTEFFKSEPIHRGEPPKCWTCGRFLGMRRWLSPRRAQLVVHGQHPGDFAFVSGSEFLISDAVVAAMQADGLTELGGLEEVEISATLMAEPARPRRYFFGEVTQPGADLDPKRSDVERTSAPECEQCLGDGVASIRGFAIDGATWSGADMFVPRGLPGVIVVSEAFRRVSESSGFSNIELVPTERYTWRPSAA